MTRNQLLLLSNKRSFYANLVKLIYSSLLHVTVIAAFGCKMRHCSLIFLKRGSIVKIPFIELQRIFRDKDFIIFCYLVFWGIVFIRGNKNRLKYWCFFRRYTFLTFKTEDLRHNLIDTYTTQSMFTKTSCVC